MNTIENHVPGFNGKDKPTACNRTLINVEIFAQILNGHILSYNCGYYALHKLRTDIWIKNFCNGMIFSIIKTNTKYGDSISNNIQKSERKK